MKELTLKQKNDFLEHAIDYPAKTKFNYYICNIFDYWMEKELNIATSYAEDMPKCFPELWTAIEKAIKKTEGIAAIHYKNHTTGRIRLLKKVYKQINKKDNK